MNALVPRLTEQANWPFADEIHKQLVKSDFSPPAENPQNFPVRAAKLNAVISARNALEVLAGTRCACCHGFGHSKKVCPTGPRLTTLMSFSITTKSKLCAARNCMVVERAHHLEPDAPIPRLQLPYKRQRTGSVVSTRANSVIGGI